MRFEFGARADMWSTKARSKYLVAPAFGQRTGMPRARFEALWSCLVFSQQTGAPGDTSEGNRWGLVHDWVKSCNSHRESRVTLSDLICVDESMSKWYGLGGDWINRGLPMFVAIDRKPGNGCEIQNAACGRSGMMMRLHIVTSAEHQRAHADEEDADIGHETAVLKRLVGPWASSGRIVCADSYYASVEAAVVLRGMGLGFEGVVKTATRGYPMSELSQLEMAARGNHATYVHTGNDGAVDLMAIVWVDRDQRYFITSASSSAPGTLIERVRCRQVGDRLERDVLKVAQPKAVELYYGCCAQIDRHNRCRQDDLHLEHKMGTHDWSLIVNLTILGICIVDSWLLEVQEPH